MSYSQGFLLEVYNRVGPKFIKGKGSYLWDEQGNKYLDLFPGWGVGILGHCHPAIVSVISQQAKELIFLPNNLIHPWQEKLAKLIVKNSFPAKVFFANSGAEAVEGAIKFSRLYGKNKRYQIITMRQSFHGRTFGAMTITGQKKYKLPFKPLIPGVKEVKFNDLNSFKKSISSKTVAVIMELIQGEGGVNIADYEYVQQVRKLCDKHNLLLIIDEVQTGMGRTGKMFAYQHYAILPDILLLAKGLGAGVPISAMVIRKEIADIMQPGHHASTFGGNPLVTRVGVEVFKVIKEERILQNVVELEKIIFQYLQNLKNHSSIIRQIRGKGLMFGIELTSFGEKIMQEALRRKLIINLTQGNVLRIMPALNISKKDLFQGLAILEEIMKSI